MPPKKHAYDGDVLALRDAFVAHVTTPLFMGPTTAKKNCMKNIGLMKKLISVQDNLSFGKLKLKAALNKISEEKACEFRSVAEKRD